MGGWEYSYATRELTWTEEMFRIYETQPKDFAVSWGIDARALHAGIAAAFQRCLRRGGNRQRRRLDAAEGDANLDLEL